MRRRVLGFGECCYHVVSRINERRYYLGTTQKHHFMELLERAADFSGVEILTYCLMDDHFHLLIRIPRAKQISDKELLRRLKVLYKPEEYDELAERFQFYLDADDRKRAYAFRERYTRRMYNLSEFVRTLKHRFSLWYNKQHDREGPLWTGRFKSVLVQSSADMYGMRALSAVAAYIDLNAVRAELVANAEEYPWCGFAKAAKQDKKQLKNLKFMLERARKRPFTSKNAFKTYQNLLKSGFSSKIDRFSSGWILGASSFVDFVSRRRPECFKTGPFTITEDVEALPESGLCTVMRQRPFFPPHRVGITAKD